MKPRNLMFWLYAVTAVPGRFRSLFYRAHRQTATQMGILFGAQTVITLPSIPYFSHVADCRSKEAVVLLLQIWSTVIFLSQIPLLPSAHIVPHAVVFPSLLIASVAFSICISPLLPIMNGIAMEHLQKNHGTNGQLLFGRERLWGSIGWAVASLFSGILFDVKSIGVKGIYIIHTILSVILCIVVFRSWCERYNTSFIRNEDGSLCRATDVTSDISSDGLISSLRKVFNQGELMDVLFFIVVFWMAAAIAAVENLLFVFLVSTIGASNTLCGYTVVVSIIFEVPVYFLAPHLLKRLSTGATFVIGAIALLIRMVGFSLATNGWHVLLVEPMHGVTFATADVAAVAYVAANTPGGGHAVAQSAIFVVRAVGMAIGSVAGGWVLQQFGARVLYLSIGAIVFATTVLFACAEAIIHRRTLTSSPLPSGHSITVSNVDCCDEQTTLLCTARDGTLLPEENLG